MKKVLFVCLGNICRSPTAHAILQHKISYQKLDNLIAVDSAGTSGYHAGCSPDSRSLQAALKRGYSLAGLKSRSISITDFYEFDLILAMDEQNFADIKQIMPTNASAEVDLFLRRYNIKPFAVPDPYYGSGDGFNLVLDLLEQATDKLISELVCNHQ